MARSLRTDSNREIIPSNVAAVGIAAAGFLATRGAGALAKVAAFGGGAVVIGAMAAKRERGY